MLELKEATLSIGGRTLLNRLSMMAMDGRMTCVTGPAGSGKTLLLRVLMGFMPLDDGLVSVDGELITPLSAAVFRRRMAYVPQVTAVEPSSWVPPTDDMESIFSPVPLPVATAQAVSLPVVTVSDKPIVLADDPAVALLSRLRALADEGRSVVVASRREEYLSVSDKIINITDHDTIIH